jgi:hypothetical protein
VTTSSGAGLTRLYTLDPQFLVGRSTLLPGSGTLNSVGSMALAGGWLWVGNGDTLNRVSLTTGRVTARVAFPGSAGVDVAADPGGRVLLVSESSHQARISRLDPNTGAVIAQTGPLAYVDPPSLAGVAGHTAWIVGFAANGVFVADFDVSALGSSRPSVSATGKKGLSARVIGNTLLVTDPGGPQALNYCADPVTGQPRAALRLPQGEWLAGSDQSSVYLIATGHPHRDSLLRLPLDPRCR